MKEEHKQPSEKLNQENTTKLSRNRIQKPPRTPIAIYVFKWAIATVAWALLTQSTKSRHLSKNYQFSFNLNQFDPSWTHFDFPNADITKIESQQTPELSLKKIQKLRKIDFSQKNHRKRKAFQAVLHYRIREIQPNDENNETKVVANIKVTFKPKTDILFREAEGVSLSFSVNREELLSKNKTQFIYQNPNRSLGIGQDLIFNPKFHQKVKIENFDRVPLLWLGLPGVVNERDLFHRPNKNGQFSLIKISLKTQKMNKKIQKDFSNLDENLLQQLSLVFTDQKFTYQINFLEINNNPKIIEEKYSRRQLRCIVFFSVSFLIIGLALVIQDGFARVKHIRSRKMGFLNIHSTTIALLLYLTYQMSYMGEYTPSVDVWMFCFEVIVSLLFNYISILSCVGVMLWSICMFVYECRRQRGPNISKFQKTVKLLHLVFCCQGGFLWAILSFFFPLVRFLGSTMYLGAAMVEVCLSCTRHERSILFIKRLIVHCLVVVFYTIPFHLTFSKNLEIFFGSPNWHVFSLISCFNCISVAVFFFVGIFCHFWVNLPKQVVRDYFVVRLRDSEEVGERRAPCFTNRLWGGISFEKPVLDEKNSLKLFRRRWSLLESSQKACKNENNYQKANVADQNSEEGQISLSQIGMARGTQGNRITETNTSLVTIINPEAMKMKNGEIDKKINNFERLRTGVDTSPHLQVIKEEKKDVEIQSTKNTRADKNEQKNNKNNKKLSDYQPLYQSESHKSSNTILTNGHYLLTKTKEFPGKILKYSKPTQNKQTIKMDSKTHFKDKNALKAIKVSEFRELCNRGGWMLNLNPPVTTTQRLTPSGNYVSTIKQKAAILTQISMPAVTNNTPSDYLGILEIEKEAAQLRLVHLRTRKIVLNSRSYEKFTKDEDPNRELLISSISKEGKMTAGLAPRTPIPSHFQAKMLISPTGDDGRIKVVSLAGFKREFSYCNQESTYQDLFNDEYSIFSFNFRKQVNYQPLLKPENKVRRIIVRTKSSLGVTQRLRGRSFGHFKDNLVDFNISDCGKFLMILNFIQKNSKEKQQNCNKRLDSDGGNAQRIATRILTFNLSQNVESTQGLFYDYESDSGGEVVDIPEKQGGVPGPIPQDCPIEERWRIKYREFYQEDIDYTYMVQRYYDLGREVIREFGFFGAGDKKLAYFRFGSELVMMDLESELILYRLLLDAKTRKFSSRLLMRAFGGLIPQELGLSS